MNSLYSISAPTTQILFAMRVCMGLPEYGEPEVTQSPTGVIRLAWRQAFVEIDAKNEWYVSSPGNVGCRGSEEEWAPWVFQRWVRAGERLAKLGF